MELDTRGYYNQRAFNVESPQESQAKQLALQNAQMQQTEYERKMRKAQEEDNNETMFNDGYRSSIDTDEAGAQSLNEDKLQIYLDKENPLMGSKFRQERITRNATIAKTKADNAMSSMDFALKEQKFNEAKKEATGEGVQDNLLFPTPNGMMWFDKKDRTKFGYLDMDGKKVMRSQDDAQLRGSVVGAEARARGDNEVNTDIDGMVGTTTQITDMLKGNQSPPNYLSPNNPQAPINLQPVSPTNTQNNNGMRVPTKADQAASAQTAKDQAEYNSPENTKKRTTALEFKKTTGANMIALLDNVSARVTKWSSGMGGAAFKGIPATDAYNLNSDMETLKSNFGFDRLQTMRDMSPTGGALGSVAVQELTALQASVANLDINQGGTQLKKNIAKAKVHYENWTKTLNSQSPANGTPAKTFKAPPNPAQYKGKKMRDDASGEILQSDGKRWLRVKA